MKRLLHAMVIISGLAALVVFSGCAGKGADPLGLIPTKPAQITIPMGAAADAYAQAMYLLGQIDMARVFTCGAPNPPQALCAVLQTAAQQAAVYREEISAAISNPTTPPDWGAILSKITKLAQIAVPALMGNYAPAIGAALGAMQGTTAPKPSP